MSDCDYQTAIRLSGSPVVNEELPQSFPAILPIFHVARCERAEQGSLTSHPGEVQQFEQLNAPPSSGMLCQ